MGKVSAEARKKYLDRINAYKEKAEEILKKEAIVLQVLEKDDTGSSINRSALQMKTSTSPPITSL
jgi:hypothetical protein